MMAFVLFLVVFAACTAHPPVGKPALAGAGLVLAGLFVLYQFLFFKFGEGTPGMRYAKIALCTFDDENPTRLAMRRRIAFLLLSAAPLGLGLAWAWFDEDRLAWHDRLTRMYQRSYRIARVPRAAQPSLRAPPLRIHPANPQFTLWRRRVRYPGNRPAKRSPAWMANHGGEAASRRPRRTGMR